MQARREGDAVRKATSRAADDSETLRIETDASRKSRQELQRKNYHILSRRETRFKPEKSKKFGNT